MALVWMTREGPAQTEWSRSHRLSKYNYPIYCLVIFRTKCFKDKYKTPHSCVLSSNKLCCGETLKGSLMYDLNDFLSLFSQVLFQLPKEKLPKLPRASLGGRESRRHW
jgi:hypothetical protein